MCISCSIHWSVSIANLLFKVNELVYIWVARTFFFICASFYSVLSCVEYHGNDMYEICFDCIQSSSLIWYRFMQNIINMLIEHIKAHTHIKFASAITLIGFLLLLLLLLMRLIGKCFMSKKFHYLWFQWWRRWWRWEKNWNRNHVFFLSA